MEQFDNDKRCRLELIGITYQQVESNVFALILQQVGTNRRIPIFIGYSEAQAIECKLQNVETPRPLTHDTMLNSLKAFGVSLKEVVIRQLPNGVFAANLVLSDGFTEKTVDSRSSDAVALAVRVDAPIYTTEEVLRKVGFDNSTNVSGTPGAVATAAVSSDSQTLIKQRLDTMSISDLEAAMQAAVDSENYEEAAKIKAEIEKRRG